ncbi:MAG: site-2 protease family protein [Bryobacteraceae bacterium]
MSPEVSTLADPTRRPRYWLHALLFALTLLTTTIVGARMQQDFQNNAPFAGFDSIVEIYSAAWHAPATLLLGLPFSLTLLAILLAHELGHFIACRRYGVDASLPYFLPAPVLIGTFGAFIRIRAPIYSRRTLFDISVAGPVAGFVLLAPALSIGLAYSKVLPGLLVEGDLRFGTSPLVWLFARLIFPGTDIADVYLHPVARAAAIGLLATAWNLLPIGQLDGGHILYSVAGPRHKFFTLGFLVALFALGLLFWKGWILWAVLLFFVRRHPSIYDPAPLGPQRRRWAWIALAIFLVSFTVTPIEEIP